jgi:hypothetical protein
MIRISNKKTGESETVNAKTFYNKSLHPMIYDPAPYGKRDWDKPTSLFFNIPKSNSELSKSQLRDTFRRLRPDLNLFLELVKQDEHPLRMLVDYPYNYGRVDKIFLFEQDNKDEIYMGQHFDPIAIKFIDE